MIRSASDTNTAHGISCNYYSLAVTENILSRHIIIIYSKFIIINVLCKTIGFIQKIHIPD